MGSGAWIIYACQTEYSLNRLATKCRKEACNSRLFNLCLFGKAPMMHEEWSAQRNLASWAKGNAPRAAYTTFGELGFAYVWLLKEP